MKEKIIAVFTLQIGVINTKTGFKPPCNAAVLTLQIEVLNTTILLKGN
jgi:hypothetical protein